MSGIVLDQIVKTGLIFYVDPANTRCFTVGGSTLKELTNTGSGTLLSGTGSSTANSGIWTFDGTDDYIDMGTRIPNLNLSPPMSIDAWFNFTAGSYIRAKTIFATAINPTNTVYLGFSVGVSTAYNINVVVGNGVNNGVQGRKSLLSTNTITTGVWNHVVATVDSSLNFQIYLNGVLQSGTVSGDAVSLSNGSSATAQIGQGPGYSDKFIGSISSVKLYNTQLSASEVLQNYNATKKRFGL